MSKNPRITSEEVGIIKRAQAGDMSAFNTLFNKYKKFVESILFQYIKDMDEARDVTNMVFLTVYKKLSMFVAYDSFGGWLGTLASRVAIDYMRKMEKRSKVLGDTDSRLPSEETSGSAEDDLVNHLTYNRILAEFDKFPETTRKVLKLFYANNMTVEQISNKLNVPTGTIKSMLSRTRRKIKKSLNV